MSFAPVRLDGGGCANVHARSASGVLVAGADTQGFYLSTNNATSWTVQNTGIGKSAHWRQCATLLWSLTETSPPVIYAGVGETGSGGGLLAGTYSGGKITWALRSGVPQWAGNQAGGAFPGPNAGWQRPTGRLLYQDASFLFAGTFKQGVLRSATGGNDDFPVACQMAGAAPGTGNWWCQAISGDPSSATTIWAGFYDNAGNGAGLWKCANAHAGTPNFIQVAGGPAIVLDIFPVGDYLYVAGAGQGVYRYGPLSGSPAWANLNGASVPNPGGTAADWWSNVCGYVDGSSNHVVIIGNSNNTTPSQCLMRLVVPSNYPTGGITYSNEAASVQTATEPPGYTWWHHGGSYQNWLGGGGYFCPFLTVDASNLSAVNWWCAGSEGSFRNLAGAGWQLANSGMPQFLAHPVAANPVHAGHVVFGDSDWCVFDDTAPGTETQATLLNDKLPGGNQGQALCFSPDGATVYGSQGAKYANNSGDACSRPWNQPANWTSLHLGSAVDGAHSVGGKVAIGMAAFDDAGGTRVVVAAVWGSGLWRWTSAGGWKFKNATIAASGSAGNQIPVTYYGGGLVFVYDRKTGIWRSTDYGLTWTLMWNQGSTDVQSGTVAYDVTRTGRLWVSTGGKLYKLTGADTGTVAGGGVTGAGTAVTPAGTTAGPVACDALGNFYYVTQDQGSGSGFLLSSDDGRTFTDIVGDGSFGRCNCNPEFIAIGPVEATAGAPRIYVSGSNVVAQGYPAGSPAGGTSSAFTERQGSLNHAGVSGVLSLWFDQGGGAVSLAGSMLSARLECSDGTATFTAPAGWQLDQDIAANPASTTTARAMVWSQGANPGGLGGSQSYTATSASPCVLTVTGAAPANGAPVTLNGSVPTGFTANTVYYVVASAGSTFELAATAGGAAINSTTAVTTGGILAFPQVFTCSNTAAAFKGKIFEYTTPAGTAQFADQAGAASATTTATSLPVTAGGANNYTGGLAVANFAAYWSVAPTGQTWTTPTGWGTDLVGVGNNTTLSFATYSQTGITAGPSTITGVIVPGSGGTMTSWAAGIVTYYAAAASPVSVTTTSLPSGTLGTAYSATLHAAGGIAPYTWAVTSGALPTSLSLSAGGVISGTPTVGGPFTFTVTVTDSLAQAATATFTVTIATAITITTASPLPAGVTGTDYRQVLAASGGTSPYAWALTSGAMPPGINLDTIAGVIAGQPLLAGTYVFTITATDALAATVAKSFTLVITTGALTVLTGALSPGRLGEPYSAQLTAGGGTPPYTWSLFSGSLPPGLSLSAGSDLAGAFLNFAAMGAADTAGAIALWESWTGRHLSAVRDYAGVSDFTIFAKYTAVTGTGRKLCLTLRPAYNPVSATDLANMNTMLSTMKAAGANVEVTLWHEPLFQGLSSAQYIAMVQYYAATVRAYYPLVFVTANSQVVHTSENTYYPGDAYIDKIATDYYALGWAAGDTLDLAASIADNASPPKPFGIWEMNSPVNGGNLLSQPGAGFEPNSTGNWTATGNCTTAASSAQAHSGSWSLALTATVAANMGAAHCTAASITTNGIACAAGDQILASVWSRAATAAQTVTARADFYTSGGAFISTLSGTGVINSTSGWVQATATVTAPATAAWCRINPLVATPAGIGEVHYFDDALLSNLSYGLTQAQITAFYGYVQSFFTARAAAGKPNANLIEFNGPGFLGPGVNSTPILGPSDFRVPLYASLAQNTGTLGGTVTGTLSAAGDYPFTVHVTDSS